MATAAPETTLAEVAARMERLGVGTVVVLDIDGRPVGTLSEREIVLRAVARDLLPSDTFVVEVMSTPVPPELMASFMEGAVEGETRGGRDASILVPGPYETLSSLVALDDALTMVDAELARRGGSDRRVMGPRDSRDGPDLRSPPLRRPPAEGTLPESAP